MASRVTGQPMFKLLEEAQALERSGKDIIHFELGDPDFDTPENISNEAIKAIKNRVTFLTQELREISVQGVV